MCYTFLEFDYDVSTGKSPPLEAFKDIDKIKPSDVSKTVGLAVEKIVGLEFDVTGAAFEPITKALLDVHRKTLTH